MTTVYSKLNNPSDSTPGGDSQNFMVLNADVDLIDKISYYQQVQKHISEAQKNKSC